MKEKEQEGGREGGKKGRRKVPEKHSILANRKMMKHETRLVKSGT